MRDTRPENISVEALGGICRDPRHQCHHTIVLDGLRYACLRYAHGGSGAHDAFTKHTDGYLVRW